MNKFYCSVAIIMFFNLSCWGQTQTTYWTGDGGRGKTVTVSEPIGTGLSAQEQALLPLIQSTIIASFQRFSAMTVFDRQNLENILREQRLSLSGNFSDNDYIRIGNLTNARLVVFGKITKISNNYMLEFAVTDVESGKRIASYPPRQVSLLALQNLSAVREASTDLLNQLGINLTANGLQELRRQEDTARIQSQNALANGIDAQRQGSIVEALTYYFQAATLDPSLNEAFNRVSIVSSNISSGNLGQEVRNRLQVHDNWRTIVNTANTFYENHLPYEFIYDTDIKRGTINFEKRTTELSIGISLAPNDAWKTINDLRQGLRNAHQQNETWNFNLNQIGPRQINVTVRIINENNIVLQEVSHIFRTLNERDIVKETLTFPNVRADDITDRLTVQIVNINGIPAQRASEIGFIQITILQDYNKRMRPIWDAQETARKKREVAEETARKHQETFKHTSLIPPVLFELGYIFQQDYPLGFRMGMFGFYTTWNFHIPDWQGYEHFWTYITAAPDYIDNGNRAKESFEWILGFSINVFDNLLTIPIGVGGRYTKEYGLYTETHTYSSNDTEWYPLYTEMKSHFLFEAGISFNPIKWVSLIGTLRVIGFQELSFTIGTCLTVPLRVK